MKKEIESLLLIISKDKLKVEALLRKNISIKA